MYPLSRGSFSFSLGVAIVLALAFCLSPDAVLAQILKITSDPPGATVELDGVPVGPRRWRRVFREAISTGRTRQLGTG